MDLVQGRGTLTRRTTRFCRDRLAAELEQMPWSSKERRYFLTREEEYVGGIRAAMQIWQRMLGGKWSEADALLVRSMVDWPGGLELHIGVRSFSRCSTPRLG
jgi:acyl-CoA oxidase